MKWIPFIPLLSATIYVLMISEYNFATFQISSINETLAGVNLFQLVCSSQFLMT